MHRFPRRAYTGRVDFAELARLPDGRMDLCLGALLIAADAYPGLDFERERAVLDALAELRLPSAAGAEEQAAALREHLYLGRGFSGDGVDYSDPRSSYINEVLARRTGLPIALALVYTEVARRLGVVARGVSFPGHYLVRVETATEALIVDPMDGRVLGRRALEEMWRRAGGTHAPLDERYLEPAGTRATLVRMLNNLRGVYATRGDFPALLVVLDRLLELEPDALGERRDRGLVAARLGAPEAALADLEAYVASAPNAGDVAEVRRLIDQIASRPPRPAN